MLGFGKAKKQNAEIARLRALVEEQAGQMADLENLSSWLAHDVPVLLKAVEWAQGRGERLSQVAMSEHLRLMWETR